MSNALKFTIVLIIGLIIGYGVSHFMGHSGQLVDSSNSDEEAKPLYWVAPMDANYRRDKPGKSPMGMDLIPVYEEAQDNDYGPGAVKVAPHVVNNLGVRTARVELSPINKVISTVGYVQYDEDRLIHIHPRVEGWIEQLFVKAAGDPVEQGQALYTLYSPALVSAQEELLIALKRNNKSLIEAAKERLLALELTPQFIQQLSQTKQVKQNITFYAPQSGVLDGLKIREGFFVKPGTTLMSIGQLEQVWVEAEVFERDAAFVKTGLPVTMTLDYLPGQEWQGQVDYVYPSLNAQTRTLRVRLRFDNPSLQLKPNMYAQVTIVNTAQTPSLLVDKAAVIRTGKQDRVVLALDQGQFKSVEVKVGAVEADKIEVLNGLREGDEVVVSAQFLIDSESSKNSDFMRMSDPQEQSVASATVEGVINEIDRNKRIMNISRDAIEKWGRPAATMDFLVARYIDLAKFSLNQRIRFTFEVRDDFVITDVAPVQMMHPTMHHEHVDKAQ